MSGDRSVAFSAIEGGLVAFGRNKEEKKDDGSSNLWTLEAGFKNLWKIDSVSNTQYVLKGRSAETHGWLNMTLVIDRRSGAATCTAQWNSRKVEPAPDPVNLNVKLTLKKGRQTKRLTY